MRGFGLAAAIALFAASPAFATGDVSAGHEVYQSRCSICHAIAAGQNRIGPSLYGVIGRTAGTEPDYSYSPAMKAYGKVWDAATLDVYLTNPRKVVPGTKMSFIGLSDATDRANVIAFLSTLK